MFFLLKSDVQGELEKVLTHLQDKMKNYCRELDVTRSQPPSKVRLLIWTDLQFMEVVFRTTVKTSHSFSI